MIPYLRLVPTLPVGLMTATLVFAGCAGDDRIPVQPVSGKLLVDGKPAAKAQVVFHSMGSQTAPARAKTNWIIQPAAIVEADGSFQPNTYITHDGAPAGDYALTVIWPTITIDQGEEIAGEDRLRGKYSDPRNPAAKVTINEGNNILPPIDLKSH